MLVVLEYIKYRWKAKRRHGIHSPFVYEFTDKCLRTNLKEKDQQILGSIFNSLSKNNKTIEIHDFGAGSKRMNNFRKISSIFKTSSSKGKFGKLIYQLCRHYKPKNILELGTSLGVGTSHMALGNPNAKITTIEACPNTYREALSTFERLQNNNITAINSTFDNYFETTESQSFDLVFIDGHHDGEALIRYMEKLSSYSHDETIFILDDIRWSDSMLNAWEKIKSDQRYHVSIDLFRMGIVIPRSKQEKESFTVRL